MPAEGKGRAFAKLTPTLPSVHVGLRAQIVEEVEMQAEELLHGFGLFSSFRETSPPIQRLPLLWCQRWREDLAWLKLPFWSRRK